MAGSLLLCALGCCSFGEGNTIASMYLPKSSFDDEEIQECACSLRDWRLDNTGKPRLEAVIWRISVRVGSEAISLSRRVIK
jgi:hypothetical protein